MKRLLVLTISLVPACPAWGQSLAAAAAAPKPAPAPQAASAPKPPFRLGGVVFNASIRSRVETWDWFTPDSGDTMYGYSGNLLRFGFSQNRETWDWDAEFAVPFLLGLPANPIGPGTQGALGLGANYLTANDRNQNTAMIFPKQVYARFTQLGGSKAHQLKIGRFEFLDGSEMAPKSAALATVKASRVNQRLLGNFGWAHVTRSFDGLQYSYNKPWGNFTFVGAVPTRGVFQVDGWGWNNAAFGYASLTRPWGTGKHSAETRIFGLVYDDWRQVLKTDSRALAIRRGDTGNIKVGTFGGHTLHAFATKAGTIDFLAWGAAQTGKWGAQDHEAYAIDVEGGIQPPMWRKLKPWFRGGFYRGSGDGNPNDGTHGTFFQVLPTPRPFAKMPFFNMMNNQEVFGILTLRPHAKVTIISEFHALRLTTANDLWYLGGGAFQPWNFGYIGRASGGALSLANLYDTGIDFRITPNLTLSPYFGFAQGRAVMSSIYPLGTNAMLGYMELNYRF
jgi:hypothetical protein